MGIRWTADSEVVARAIVLVVVPVATVTAVAAAVVVVVGPPPLCGSLDADLGFNFWRNDFVFYVKVD